MDKFLASNKPYTILGLMSGTSLDGLDLAACRFVWNESDQRWTYHIICAETIPYHRDWQEKLCNAHKISAIDFVQLHTTYGIYIGEQAYKFISNHGLRVDAIASHGHTVFHQPENYIHFQIGNGTYIAAQTNLITVSDFRNQDIALGGQGAPLVPIGDELLFSHMDGCLNLGGFANISFGVNEKRIAFDVAPCNIVLNKLATQVGRTYDEDGQIARSGEFIKDIFESLNQLEYYQLPYPKSLGYEWVVKYIEPIFQQYKYSVNDVMHTFCVHVAHQLARSIPKGSSILATGGGVFNGFLMEQIRKHVPGIVVPDADTIQFKEALIFAFLGLLKLRSETNVLKTVTGCLINHSSGVVHVPY